MQIIWHGQSFFEIKVKGNKENGEIKIAIDPYNGISLKSRSGRLAEGKNRPFDDSLGLKVPKVEADILLITHSHYDHSNKKVITGEPFLIEEPGEYEVKGIFVKGIPAFHDNSGGKERGQVAIYKIEAEDMKICHLGDLGQKELSSDQLEEIGEVDILMVPVGGTYTIDPREAANVVSQIEPKIVIPMHYKIPKLKLELEGLEKFLKVMGAEDVQPQKKLKISLKDLPKEETEIMVLQP
jgi:L-ascorbate metabolism protein UlaG (beta-lactamase superfamily)